MFRWRRSPAQRQLPLALVCLTFFVLLLPLTLTKPGIPTVLKADEAAFYLGALSLWHDGDFRCEDKDARRLFREFSRTSNLLLMSGGARGFVYFSVPVPYSITAAPLVAVLGANGMALLNAALLMAMVWMGFHQLRRENGDPLALLFVCGFFLLSTAFAYVFWLQAEVLNMTCMMAAFFLVERTVTKGPEESTHLLRNEILLAAGAGAMLAVVCYSKPMFALLAIPLIFRLGAERSWKGLASFAASGTTALLLLAAVAYGLTERVWPYFGPRAGISLSSPVDYIERRVEPRLARGDDAGTTPTEQLQRGGKQLRVTLAAAIRESASEFLFGRHGGFILYMPFAVIAIILFLINDRRSIFGWLVLAASALTAVVFLAGLRGQWLGGGGFIGNRYFLTAYPAFFFLVRRVHPAWLTAFGYAAAAIFIGPLLITPLGAMVREPTLQAHVRNQPFPYLPLEWSHIGSLPGYRYVAQPGATFHGRTDEILGHGQELWIHGAKAVEVSLLSRHVKPGLVFDVRNLAPGNTVQICLRDDCQRIDFDEVPRRGERRRVTFESQEPEAIPRPGRFGARFRYPLQVKTEWGEQPRWRGSGEESFYLGVALTFLGSPEDLEIDLFEVEWLDVDAPESITALSQISIPIALRNSSSHPWPSQGPTRITLSYRWLTETGEIVVQEGRRTELPGDVQPGASALTAIVAEAPETPGRYVLVLDLVRERVRWFSDVSKELTYQVATRVTPSDFETAKQTSVEPNPTEAPR